MNIDRIPRLHATWLLVDVQLPLPFVTTGGIRASDTTHLLLVCDRGSELPMGGTVSPYPPGAREIGTALFQAIWHPGRQNWPLHGIPETIQVPQALAANGLYDLEKAAPFLLMEIDTRLKQPQNGLKQIKAMMKTLCSEGAAYLAKALPEDERIGGALIDTLLTWLQTHYFPDHTPAPVWETIREHGVIMPGYDTSAAGWLLPVVGEAETTTEGVISQGVTYGSMTFACEPGQKLPVRSYPYYYPQRENGVFVQVGTDDTAYVHYLSRKD